MTDVPTLEELAHQWNMLFHAPHLPLSLAVFRVVFGLLLTVESVGLIRHGPEIFGFNGLAPALMSASRRPATRIRDANIFLVHGNSDTAIRSMFLLHTICCILLTVGLLTRAAALLIFINFASRSKQNWYVIQGGDNVAKFMSFLLIFSNAGSVLSLDAALHLSWFGGTALTVSQWPQRLMQMQISIVYLRTVFWKLKVGQWIDGSAVFHALYRNPHLRWTSLPTWFYWSPLVATLTWGSLILEGATGILVWFRETRYATLAAAAAMHVGFAAFLRLKYFQYVMLTCLLLFVPSQKWLALWKTFSGLLRQF